MKLSLLIAFPALAIATLVYPSTDRTCGQNIGTISACGCHGLAKNYNIQSARVDFQKATARFYAEEGCVGARISVASDKCFSDAPWQLKSVKICGGTCGAC